MSKTHCNVYSGDAVIKNGMGEFNTTNGIHITAPVEKVDGNRIETREFVFHLVDKPQEPVVSIAKPYASEDVHPQPAQEIINLDD